MLQDSSQSQSRHSHILSYAVTTAIAFCMTFMLSLHAFAQEQTKQGEHNHEEPTRVIQELYTPITHYTIEFHVGDGLHRVLTSLDRTEYFLSLLQTSDSYTEIENHDQTQTHDHPFVIMTPPNELALQGLDALDFSTVIYLSTDDLVDLYNQIQKLKSINQSYGYQLNENNQFVYDLIESVYMHLSYQLGEPEESSTTKEDEGTQNDAEVNSDSQEEQTDDTTQSSADDDTDVDNDGQATVEFFNTDSYATPDLESNLSTDEEDSTIPSKEAEDVEDKSPAADSAETPMMNEPTDSSESYRGQLIEQISESSAQSGDGEAKPTVEDVEDKMEGKLIEQTSLKPAEKSADDETAGSLDNESSN